MKRSILVSGAVFAGIWSFALWYGRSIGLAWGDHIIMYEMLGIIPAIGAMAIGISVYEEKP